MKVPLSHYYTCTASLATTMYCHPCQPQIIPARASPENTLLQNISSTCSSEMDPLSAIASVIAVVQIADRIATLCKTYITGVHDAPADLRAVLIEIGSVKCALEVIELLDLSGTGDDKVKILEKLRGPLEGCREALMSLEALFPPLSPLPAKGKRERLALSLSSLAWPFKREKALKLLGEISRYKSTIIIGFTAEGA